MIARSTAARCPVLIGMAGPETTGADSPQHTRVADALAGVLDRLEQGVLIVDGGARVAFANHTARDFVDARRGLRLHNGVLQGQDARQTRLLHDSIAACARSDGGADGFFLATGDGGEAPLSGHVAALPREWRPNGPAGPVAAVFLTDLGRIGQPSVRQLRACFGLTAAEASLALEVLTGDGLQSCARRLGISPTTARTHLGHIFEKTGTRRQAELVRVILGLRSGFRVA